MASNQSRADDPTATFEALRPRLEGIAYRMTGSISDAQDLCQDAWLRWSRVDLDTIAEPEAFLVTTVTRLTLDRLRSAAHRRETYVGPYLPEPLVRDPVGPQSDLGPAEAAELADSLTFAFLVLLDELAPLERAVLLLHDVFAYPFDDVATAVDRSPAAVRQIASRARRKIEASGSLPGRPEADQATTTLTGMVMAVMSGDVEAVMAHLAPDVVQLDDGGPNRRAGRRPIVGPRRVARLWVNLAKRHSHLGLRVAEVNSRPGVVLYDGDVADMVVTFELGEDGRVRRIFTQLNPDKIAHLSSERDADPHGPERS